MKRGISGMVLASLIALASSGGTAAAGPILDPVGDFRTSAVTSLSPYAGPLDPALDVVAAQVILDPFEHTLTFWSQMAGPVTPATAGFYVWGVNRGNGTPGFASIGLPGVIFAGVVLVRPNGSVSFGANTIPSGAVTLSGNTITAVVPLSFIPPVAGGLPMSEWGYNLWPRTTAVTGNIAISDFAPDNSTFLADVVAPEPATISAVLLGIGAGLIRRFGRSRRS